MDWKIDDVTVAPVLDLDDGETRTAAGLDRENRGR
jgi:hypothetical protein